MQAWRYDAYSDHGGTPGPWLRADDASWTEKLRGSRFVDITELGERVGLERICSWRNYEALTTNLDWGLCLKQTVCSSADALDAFAKDMVAARGRPDVATPMRMDGQTIGLDELRPAATARWAKLVVALWQSSHRIHRSRGHLVLSGSRIEIRGGYSATAREALNAIADELAKVGDDAVMAEGLGERTASAWATYLRELPDRLEAAAPASRTDGAVSSSKKVPSQLVLDPIVARTAAGPVCLRHDERIIHPRAGLPIAMEWWHFQRTDLVREAGSFGALLRAVGWSDAGLLARVSATYGKEGLGYEEGDLDQKKAW